MPIRSRRWASVAFADRAQAAGVDGVLVVDYPPEEAADFAQLMDAHGIAPIFLLAPTTPEARIAEVARIRPRLRLLRLAEGRDRCRRISTRRTSRASSPRSAATCSCRSASASAFAMRQSAQAIAAHADAVVIGSRIIQEIESGPAGGGGFARRRLAWYHPQRVGRDGAQARARRATLLRGTPMTWLQKLLPPRIKRTPGERRTPVPEGLWVKCPSCEAVLYRTDLENNLYVCPKCGHHQRVAARERIEQLLDPEGRFEIGSEVVPIDSLKFKDQKKYPDRLAAALEDTGETDALVVMQGSVKSVPLVLAAFEFEFMGGSMGSVVGERFVRGVRVAYENRVPFVCVSASGGARMQEGVSSLFQMAKTTAVLQELNKARLPFVSILTDPTMGGVSASFAFVADLVLAEPGALIGFAGPRVIEQTVREKLPEGFQRAEFLMEKGALDLIVDRRQLRDELARLLALLTRQPAPSVSPARGQ